jgi:hypothetical protein
MIPRSRTGKICPPMSQTFRLAPHVEKVPTEPPATNNSVAVTVSHAATDSREVPVKGLRVRKDRCTMEKDRCVMEKDRNEAVAAESNDRN